MKGNTQPSMFLSLFPLIVLIILLVINVQVFGDDATGGANQMALLFSTIVACVIAVTFLKQSYKDLEGAAIKSLGLSLQANIILLVVGALIGVWILSGVVPTMIYYGIKLIHPSIFLPVTTFLCCIVSLATGSSWSTGGTIGIALMGIGHTLGIPDGLTAGAIISGAYFGDKMSPLSDTTNLAPAMAGTDLFTHVKHMLYTTIPSITISLILFTILGLSYTGQNLNTAEIDEVLKVIGENFNISLILFILPLAVIIMVKMKVPAIPALIMGTLLGLLLALIFQQDLLLKQSEGTLTFKSIYTIMVKTSYAGFEIETGNALIDKLFSRGGMSGMLNTVWLIIMAMLFGGIMEATGMLATIANGILKLVKGTTSLVASTVSSAVFLNVTASDQYLAIVVTARMFKDAYAKAGLHPKNLSRAVEDSATATSVLIPWNTCGAYFSTILGVATTAYLPFCFFNLISPFMSVIVAASGKTMDKLDDE